MHGKSIIKVMNEYFHKDGNLCAESVDVRDDEHCHKIGSGE